MEIMHSLEVEWRHGEGQTPPSYHCTDTDRNFFELLEEITPILESDGIRVVISEKTTADREGSGIFLNGRLLEELLDEAAQSQTYCHSTKWDSVEESRQVVPGPGGTICQEASEILFRKATLRALEPDYRQWPE